MKKKLDMHIYDDFKRNQILLLLVAFLGSSLCVVDHYHRHGLFSLSFIIEFPLLLALFRFYYLAQKERNYTFWGLSFFIALYFIRQLYTYLYLESNNAVLYLVLTAIICFVFNLYFMSSPLYFPRVQWWEYDFRYRADLKVKVLAGETFHEARLTDLRRGAGCLEIFKFFPAGTELRINLQFDDTLYDLPVIVKSVGQRIPGRPFTYGVRFQNPSEQDRKVFLKLQKLWHKQKKVKIRNKFKDSKKIG